VKYLLQEGKTRFFRLFVPIILVLCVLLVVGCNLLLNPPTAESVHLLLGNPSNATASILNSNNYLMLKPQFALSYNNGKHIPNWVSWQLNSSWLGEVTRRNDFRPDEALPDGWERVVPSDYNGSGYDRGHMAPSGDRTRTVQDNSATFVMTNILPQAPDNNQGPWAELENYCRELVRDGKELYIVAGGYGQKKSISKGKVAVPARVWKVIVVLERVGAGIEGITPKTRVIAVDMPNSQGIQDKNWRSFRVSVDQIEAATGFDFLSNVPATVQQVLESKVS
jgi:endonuclease G, mitochondrial